MGQHVRPTFAALLKSFRADAGLSQEELSERSGVTVSAISMLERGVRRSPFQHTVARLAAGLDLTPQEYALFEEAARSGKQVAEASTAPTDAASVQPISHVQARMRSTPDLVGRDHELEWLRGELAAGRPLLLLSGEPGIGKTRILDEMRSWARRHGWSVLWGDCHRRSGQEPYAPLVEALERHTQALSSGRLHVSLRGCEWLARLLPELASAGESALPTPPEALPSAQEQRLMFAAVERYLSNIAGSAGTLLVLDDLQWAGDDALRLLTRLIQSAHMRRIRILGAFRSTEAAPGSPLSTLIADLAREDLVSQIDLAPLESQDALAMAHALLDEDGEPPGVVDGGALLEDVVKRAEGVPFLIVNFARGLLLPTASQRLTGAPRNVTQSILERVAALPAPARDLLGAAAVIGQLASCETLAAGVGQSEMEALDSLETACLAGLLFEEPEIDHPERYRFFHDVIRDVVEANLSAARQTVLHRRVAAALEQVLRRNEEAGHVSDRLLAQVAYHFARADAPEQAARYLRRAGDQARRVYAHQEAAQYYQELIACLDRLQMRREVARARKDLAVELAHIGRYTEAVETLAQAGDIYQALGDIESLAMVVADIASAHTNRGAVSAGLAELLPIVENLSVSRPGEHEAATTLSPAIRAWLLGTLAHLYFMDERYDEALRTAEQSLDVAQATENSALIGRAHLERGVALYVLGRTPEAAEILQLAITCLETASSRELGLQALLMAIWVAQTQGDFPRSRDLQQRALVEAQDFGDPAIIGQAFIFVGLLAFYTGDWGLARTLAMSSANAFGEVESSAIGSYPPLGLGILCLVSGEREEAMRHLDLARVIAARSDGKQVLRLIEALLAEDELVHDQGAAACDRLAPLLASHALEERTRIELQTLYAWGLLQLGALAEAEALTLQAVQGARDHAMGLLLPDALRVRALCAIERQEWLVATDALEQAIALCARMPYPYAEAKARYVYGQLWLAISEPVRARQQFEQARALCQQLGERLYGAAIDACLRD